MFSILAYVILGFFLLAAIGLVYGGIVAKRPAKPPQFGRKQNTPPQPVDPKKAKLGTISMWAGFAIFGLTLPMFGGCMVFDAYVNFINPDFYVQRKMYQDKQRELREAREAVEEERWLAEAKKELASTLKNLPEQPPSQPRVPTNASIKQRANTPTMAAAPVPIRKQAVGSTADMMRSAEREERRRQQEYEDQMGEAMAAEEEMQQEIATREKREEKRREEQQEREMEAQMAAGEKEAQMESERYEAGERRKRAEAGMAQENGEREAER